MEEVELAEELVVANVELDNEEPTWLVVADDGLLVTDRLIVADVVDNDELRVELDDVEAIVDVKTTFVQLSVVSSKIAPFTH